jgi:hypothetical protein
MGKSDEHGSKFWPNARRRCLGALGVLILLRSSLRRLLTLAIGSSVALGLGLAAAVSAQRPLNERGAEVLPPSDEDYYLGRARVLPAPGPNAIPYEVREELRNGDTVPIKRRWLEVPPGQLVTLVRKADGRWEPDIPPGTKLWKEFWLDDGENVGLVERRLTLKIDDAVAKALWHDDPWIFLSAFELPAGQVLPPRNGWSAVGPVDSGLVLTRFASAEGTLPIQSGAGPLEMFTQSTDCWVSGWSRCTDLGLWPSPRESYGRVF